MPQLVDIHGKGTVEFPDDMSQEDMAEAIYRNFPDLDKRPFEDPITPEEERKLPLPIPKPTLREDIRDTIQENLRDLPGLPTRLLTAAGKATGLVSPDAPELPTIPQAIGGTLAMGGEAAAGAVSRMVRGDPWHTVISQFGRGPEQLATGEKESLARVIPIEMARMAPAIAATTALTMAGVPPPIAGGVPFGLQTFGQTGDPVAAMQSGAIGALIPGVGSAGRAGGELMAQRAAARLGAGEIATRGLEATGRLVGSQSLVGGLLTASAAPELMELAKSDPEGFQHEMIKIVAMNLAFEAPHLGANVRQVMARERVDQYMREPAYKRDIDNLLVRQEQAKRQQGIVPIPPEELARLRDTAKVAQEGIKAGLPMGTRAFVDVAVNPETATKVQPDAPVIEPIATPKVDVPVAEPVVAPKVEPSAPVAELEATPKAVAEPAQPTTPAPISSPLVEAKAETVKAQVEGAAASLAEGDFSITKRSGGLDVSYTDPVTNKRVGYLQIDTEPSRATAIVKAVDVDEGFTRRGIATQLYEKAKQELQQRGITIVKGAMEGSGVVQIREKVFGSGNTKYFQGGAELTVPEAIKLMDVDFGRVIAETTLKPSPPPPAKPVTETKPTPPAATPTVPKPVVETAVEMKGEPSEIMDFMGGVAPFKSDISSMAEDMTRISNASKKSNPPPGVPPEKWGALAGYQRPESIASLSDADLVAEIRVQNIRQKELRGKPAKEPHDSVYRLNAANVYFEAKKRGLVVQSKVLEAYSKGSEPVAPPPILTSQG